MYCEKFIAVVKCDGKNLRERNGKISIPFGSEYSIFMKNLEDRDALVSVTIDGKSIGCDLIVDNRKEGVLLERFVTSNDQGNRFKFIKKTEEIAQHRGDFVEDGLVVIKFRFVKRKPEEVVENIYHYNHHYNNYYHYPHDWWKPCAPWKVTNRCTGLGTPTVFETSTTTTADSHTFTSSSTVSGKQFRKITAPGISTKITDESYQPKSLNMFSQVEMPEQDEGITVKGSISYQKFINDHIGELEDNEYTIVFKLVGHDPVSKKEIIKPLETRAKLVCETCGRTSASSAQYCFNCGTYLS